MRTCSYCRQEMDATWQAILVDEDGKRHTFHPHCWRAIQQAKAQAAPPQEPRR
jgi:hypothetical protein